MPTRQEVTEQLTEALAALLEEMWGDLRPGAADDDLDDLEVAEVFAEMGTPYVSAWALVIGISSIDNAEAPDLVVHYRPRGQRSFTTRGLLSEAIDEL